MIYMQYFRFDSGQPKIMLALCRTVFGRFGISTLLRVTIWAAIASAITSNVAAKDISECEIKSACGAGAAVSNGNAVAGGLNGRYQYMVNQCPNGKPAYYCSGIAIRATVASKGKYHEWDPSPAALDMGSVSFSYMRADTATKMVYHDHGFIFKANDDFDASTYPDLSYRCIYPSDAATQNSVVYSYGCMKIAYSVANPPYSGDVSSCTLLGVQSASDWVSKKNKDANFNCSFSTADPQGFAQALYGAYTYSVNQNSSWTELMIETWPDGVPSSLPIEAFFYTKQYTSGMSTGLQNAQALQSDFCSATKKFVPIVKLDFTVDDLNIFSYSDADQATTCDQ
ncbi:omega toxin-like domain protein (plasmid) [Ralstonia solanacearum]|nr:omega toxin-like domain protein [Ralstonia solanacearum]AXV93379.1 omega toxin-like domain protein [Ralstonia solanacearum]AXW21409.1 omega toxin-like domain protein [Ralstonia solanacearum]AXW78277.1 omega toxin-like domain protein [Ralstonia solanacearum]BEU74504.1 halovibrin HvnB [Ralstonia pseudosolanacearum]